MSNLRQIYVKLSGIEQDIAEYIEECDNDKIASDIAGKVKNNIENAVYELNLDFFSSFGPWRPLPAERGMIADAPTVSAVHRRARIYWKRLIYSSISNRSRHRIVYTNI